MKESDIHKMYQSQIYRLENTISNLMKMLADTDLLKPPAPIIFCKDCPKLDRSIIDKLTKEKNEPK